MIFRLYSFLRAAHTLTVGGAMNTAVALSQSEQVGVHKSVILQPLSVLLTGD
ncbi:hypothetical protein KKJ06_21430 [Xenorhabdus bovienii]|uniref:hypothetical protein n=1 Tax=Xenorhabdus bovienii TaxID=40576 RepID=UPI0023B2C0BC|nr:hypothetical protein [Xenorhabdus bovienii]MDE9557877.1 hypothetical protein [Xenorhabdus bovienii]